MGIGESTVVGGGEMVPDPFPGEYRFLKVLGEGTFGKVWLAQQLSLEGRPVAVKTISAPVDSRSGPSVLAALRKDATALARIRHPNVVRVHDLRTAGGQPYLIMDFVEGGSLLDRLRRKGGGIGWQEAARYVADVGEGLIEAHSLGLIHRDIKPANILLDASRDEALLADFGVSAHLAEPGTAAGTPPYMAPEAWDGRVSPALDVFSLAVTLYHLSTGAVPFPTGDPRAHRERIRRGLPDPDPRCVGLPEPLEELLRAGLAFETADRPALDRFVADLRGDLNRAIADSFILRAPAPADAGGAVRLVLSRQDSLGRFRPIPTSPPRRLGWDRNMQKVPPTPEQVQVRTGDRVRIEAIVDRGGYVTVLNVGPEGGLTLLYPDPPSAPLALRAGQRLPSVEVEMTPPAGRERLFAIWSVRPLHLGDLVTPVGSAGPDVSGPYLATRVMAQIQQALRALPPDQGHAVVIEMDHLGPGPPRP